MFLVQINCSILQPSGAAAMMRAMAQLDAEYADVVTIRTVHGAKGLEFPVVFVPDTNGAFN